jgi:hypothetical protein
MNLDRRERVEKRTHHMAEHGTEISSSKICTGRHKIDERLYLGAFCWRTGLVPDQNQMKSEAGTEDLKWETETSSQETNSQVQDQKSDRKITPSG